MKHERKLHIDWGTVVGLVIVGLAIYLMATSAANTYLNSRQARVYRPASITGDTLVEATQPEHGRPVIGPRLSRED